MLQAALGSSKFGIYFSVWMEADKQISFLQSSSSGSRELHCSPALHLSSFLVAVSEFSFKSQKVKNQSLSLSSWTIYLRSQRKHGLRSTSILSTKYKLKVKFQTLCIVFEIQKFIQMTFFPQSFYISFCCLAYYKVKVNSCRSVNPSISVFFPLLNNQLQENTFQQDLAVFSPSPYSSLITAIPMPAQAVSSNVVLTPWAMKAQRFRLTLPCVSSVSSELCHPPRDPQRAELAPGPQSNSGFQFKSWEAAGVPFHELQRNTPTAAKK